ncbi:hypothetical protein RRG08_010821 [Elysia crispata]|uniref:Uncharacterized protein n=1 Tax=Elysia crispata TaxID=231223 RepID=A0AAE1DF14_9GAST|nr:hypothetical protein RRG08_010821 [Elysia crispata]
MEKSREVLWLTKQIPLAQASCNESSPGANEQNSISFIESSLIHGKDDGTKLLSEVGFQSLEQKPPSEEFSKKDNQETPNSFHSVSSEDLSKHLTYQELHEMGLVKRFYCKNIPDSSPINVLESTIEESDESFVTCRQFSSEELLFIENVQKVRKNLNKELENNSETKGISCGDKLSYQSSATYALSSSKNRILSSDLYISESESDGFPSPLKKPTNPGPIVSNVEDRRQVDKLTPSQENSHLTRVSDLEFSSNQEIYDCVVNSELMVDADKTLIEDNEVCLSPAKELASRDESLEEGEIDDGDDGETKIVESSAKSDPASFSSKTCPRNAVIKSSENTGRADALDKKRKRLRSWPCKGFGKAGSVMSPLERIYHKQNTSRAGYNLGKTGPTFFGNRNRLASPNSKQKSLISRGDRKCDVKGRSMKKSEKLDCGKGGVNNAETKRFGRDEENDFARRRSSNRRKNEQSASTSNTKVEGKSRSSHPYGKGTNSLYDGTAEVGETEDLWTCQGNSSESLPQSAHNGVEIRNKIGSYGGKGGVQLSHGEDRKRPHIRNVCDWDTPDCKTSLNQDNP